MRKLCAHFGGPYPPSVNDYWQPIALPKRPNARRAGARIVVSPVGKRYRRDFAHACLRARRAGELGEQPLIGALDVRVVAHPPPTAHRRDADNLLKALLDAATFAGVILDDSQFVDVRIRWGDPLRTPCVQVALGRPDPRQTIGEFLGLDRETEPFRPGTPEPTGKQLEAPF